MGKALGLTKSQHKAIGRVVSVFGQSGPSDDRDGEMRQHYGGCVPAKVTTAITAGTTAQAGKGAVTLLSMSETGVYTLGESALVCWNVGAAIALNRIINVCFGTRGVWAVVDACP